MFPGAEVMRGPHWKWKNDDGKAVRLGDVSRGRGHEGPHWKWKNDDGKAVRLGDVSRGRGYEGASLEMEKRRR